MGLESLFQLSLVMNLVDNLTGPMSRVQNAVGATVTKFDTFEQSAGVVTKTGIAMTEAGRQITAAVLSPVEATFATQRSLGELSSVGIKDLALLENAATHFSDTWAGTSKADFLGAAYDIKGGIESLSDTGVAGYTSLAGITAKATKSTTSEMTSLFATGYAIYKDYYSDLNDMQFGDMFAVGIAESVRAFKTDGSGMAQSIQALGAAATAANVPFEEQLTVLGMLQATMSGSEAGTKYRSFLRSAVKGGQELGLTFVDTNNQLLSMPEILSSLRGKFGETMDAAEKMDLQKAFGDAEAVALIDLLYAKTGDLQSNIMGLYSSMGAGTGVTQEMADAINSTRPDRFQVVQQRIHNMSETIGNTLSPTIDMLLDKADGVITKTADWINENQTLVSQIMIVVLTLGGFLTVGGAAITIFGAFGMVLSKTGRFISGFIGVFGKLKGAIKLIPNALYEIKFMSLVASEGFKKAFSGIKHVASIAGSGIKSFGVGIAGFARTAATTASTALPPLIASVWSFTAALLANPITWIVIAVIALIAVFVVLYNKCEWFRNGVNAIWDGIKSGVSTTFESVKNFFGGIGNVISNVMGAAKDTVREKLDNMKSAYQSHGGGIRGIAAAAVEGVKGYYTAGFNFLDKMTGGKLTGIKDKFVEGFQKIKDWFAGLPAWFRESGSKIITTLTEGIKSAAMKPVEAVTGIFQKVRQFLPFSDAKEGPLSTLTLSGYRTMSTIADGMQQGEDLPAKAVASGLSKIALEREPLPKVGGRGVASATTSETNSHVERDHGVTIHNLTIKVDFKSIKELPLLLKLIKDLENYTNGNDLPDGTPA